jgi:hypothetical protein
MPPYEVVKLGLRLTCGGGQEKHSLQALEALPSFEQRDVGGLLVNFYNNPARPWLCNFDVFDVVRLKCVVPEGIGACKCSYIFPGGIAEMVAHRVLYGYTNDRFIFGANNEYEVLNGRRIKKRHFNFSNNPYPRMTRRASPSLRRHSKVAYRTTSVDLLLHSCALGRCAWTVYARNTL